MLKNRRKSLRSELVKKQLVSHEEKRYFLRIVIHEAGKDLMLHAINTETHTEA